MIVSVIELDISKVDKVLKLVDSVVRRNLLQRRVDLKFVERLCKVIVSDVLHESGCMVS